MMSASDEADVSGQEDLRDNGAVREETEVRTAEDENETNGDSVTTKEEEPKEEETPTVERGSVKPALENSFKAQLNVSSSKPCEHTSKPSELVNIPIGDPRVRAKLRFEVVTAKVVETAGKKHVTYSIRMRRADVANDPKPAVIERRYNDFCYVYESILRNFHPSILGDFLFPKKVLIGNFKAEVITERTEAFHKFLNLIASCDNLLYSEYFYSFLSSEEHNEAVSHIKLSRYEEAAPLLESIFFVREKLLTIGNVHVLQCLCELVATLNAVGRRELAFSYAQVAAQSFDLVPKGSQDAEVLRVPFLKLSAELAGALGHDRKRFDRPLSELRYSHGVRLESAKPLLEIIRERYIHRASHTAKLL